MPAPRSPNARPARPLDLLIPVATIVTLAIHRLWTSDDGFIFLRIAENLADGYGPVFNITERVEAGTSVLWVAMLGLWIKLGGVPEWGGAFLGVALIAAAVGLAHWRCARRGAVSVAIWFVIPLSATWDFATGGLETSLALAWIALCLLWVETEDKGLTLAGVLVGLGPLVRPDLALFSGAWLLVLAGAAWRTADGSSWRKAGRVAILAVQAAAVPCAYQVFRMGYFAALVPNTALAKGAGEARWTQGLFYLGNFADTYTLWIPVLLIGALFAAAGASDGAGLRARWAPAATVLAALLHATYVVRVGGGFMHARLLLPAWFAVCVAAPGLRIPDSWRDLRFALHRTSFLAVAIGWVAWTGATSRPPKLEYGIGDERLYYASAADEARPVVGEDFGRHHWVKKWRSWLELGGGGSRPLTLEAAMHPGAKMPGAAWLRRDVDRIVVWHSIGLLGWLAGRRVHVVDRAGLTDPIGSRLEIENRGRPGHERFLGADWIVARFGAADQAWSPQTEAARRAYKCPPLQTLLEAVTAPMTAQRFVDNILLAPSLSRLRIPSSPEASEARLCGRTRAALAAGPDRSAGPVD